MEKAQEMRNLPFKTALLTYIPPTGAQQEMNEL